MMTVYCVMSGETRCDLDHVVYASISKEKAENFAMENDFTTYDGKPYIEKLDVDEEVNADEDSHND